MLALVVLYKLSHLSNLPHPFIFLLSSLIGRLADCTIVIVVYKNVTCKYEHTQRTLMMHSHMISPNGKYQTLRNLSIQSQILK